MRVRVSGTVQGVGYRPFVYRLARSCQLCGHVRNDERGVLLEAEGERGEVDAFLLRLEREGPPLARVETVEVRELEPQKGGACEGGRHDRRGADFAILESERAGAPEASVSPDVATCEDCLRELFDPADRRHRYPFINCTNCGPRFTIVRGVPYDRPLTTMAGFEMCAACRTEYEDPDDRRFHAQPNACPRCGPRLRLLDGYGRVLAIERPAADPVCPAATELGPPTVMESGRQTVMELGPPMVTESGRQTATESKRLAAAGGGGGEPLSIAAEALRRGAILAVKGLGGCHLACLAQDERAVARLRSLKRREQKPFALMARSLTEARELARLTAVEEALLVSRERPIVLVARREGASVAAAVAPALRELGVMLPYTPLHHLLLAEVGAALVMTSGNLSDEPIAYRDEDALARLGAIADLLLLHDRPIETRADDSLARVVSVCGRRRPLLMRRARGHAPASVRLPLASRCELLACGAQQKSVFCLVRGERAWISHHIGDLESFETLRSFAEGVEHLKKLFAVNPQVVVHDLHPDYLSTAYANELDGVRLLGVQHHHAHLAACLAEHGETEAALGAIYDGTGYGLDGAVWGGELLHGDLSACERVGHLLPVRMPGASAAIREPWRMACAWLQSALGEQPPRRPARLRGVDLAAWRQVARIAEAGLASPVTTSVGRLFDAVAALCGVCAYAAYEGEAAVELEAICDPGERGAYPFPVLERDGRLLLDPRETIAALVAELDAGVASGIVAARFHNALARATASACSRAAERLRIGTVVLSGGAFQNRRLLECAASLLARAGLRVLVPEQLPPNDGGIAYGQAAVAAARLAHELEPRAAGLGNRAAAGARLTAGRVTRVRGGATAVLRQAKAV